MPWLTPNAGEVAGNICRRLTIPNNFDFITAVSGALLDLTKASNWERSGTMEPREAAELMLDMLMEYFNSDGCAGTGAGEDGCTTFAPAAPSITWEPMDPFRSPNITPPGYAAPPWYRFVSGSLLGAQPGDVMTDISKIPINQTLPNFIADGAPRFRFTWVNQQDVDAEVELHLLAIPQGGQALITIDGLASTAQFIDLNSIGILDLDLQNLLNLAAASPIQERIVEVQVAGMGQHYIDVTMLPNVSTQVLIGFGGGLRKVVLCGVPQSIPLLPPFWQDPDDVDALPTPPAQLPAPDYYLPAPEWSFEGFLAASNTPGAKVQFNTALNRVRLSFRTAPSGADFRVLSNGQVISTGSTASPTPGTLDRIITLGAGDKVLEVEHMGIIAPQAGDPPPSRLELIRQDLKPPTLRSVYGEDAPTFEQLDDDFFDAFGERLPMSNFDIRVNNGRLQKTTDGTTWTDVTFIDPYDSVTALTLPPGSDATANIANRILTFGIPRGNTGAQGAQGIQGATGATGAPGAPGQNGTNGIGIPIPPTPTNITNAGLCGTATYIVNYIDNLFNDALALLNAGGNVAGITASIVGLVATGGVAAPVVGSIAGFVSSLVSVVTSGFDAAVNTTVLEDVQCRLYCLLKANGSYSYSVLTAWQNEVVANSGSNVALQWWITIANWLTEPEWQNRAYIGSLAPSAQCEALCDACDDPEPINIAYFDNRGTGPTTADIGDTVSFQLSLVDLATGRRELAATWDSCLNVQVVSVTGWTPQLGNPLNEGIFNCADAWDNYTTEPRGSFTYQGKGYNLNSLTPTTVQIRFVSRV